jgi:hypothetical protein
MRSVLFRSVIAAVAGAAANRAREDDIVGAAGSGQLGNRGLPG